MRWVVFCFAALFAASVGLSATAQDDGKGVTIKVTVLGTDGKPVRTYVEVNRWPLDPDVKAYDRIGSESGYTEKDGTFSTATDDRDRPLPPETYRITALTSNGLADTIVYIPSDSKSPVVLTLGPRFTFVDDVDNAAKAAKAGDSAGYEQSLKAAQNWIPREEKLADEAQQSADDFARANDLPIKDLNGVTKDIERAGKLPEDLQDKALLAKLKRYQSMLKGIKNLRYTIEYRKKELAELKPPEKKFGLAPSACPEGQSGGLLAGGINSLFGTDLAGICDDKQPQHRDTDREKKGGDRHERDEHD
jgi:hypothetical protein